MIQKPNGTFSVSFKIFCTQWYKKLNTVKNCWRISYTFFLFFSRLNFRLDVFHIKRILDEGLVEAGDVCLITTIATTLHWLDDIPKVMQLLVETFSDKVVVAYVPPEIMHDKIRSIFFFRFSQFCNHPLAWFECFLISSFF